MIKRCGEIIHECWNYDIRKDGKQYFGYENKVTSNPRKPFAYVHAIKEPMEESIKKAMNKINLKKIIKPGNRVAIKVNLCGGFPDVIASQTPLKGVEGLIEYLLDFMDSSHVFLADVEIVTCTFKMNKKNAII